MPRSISTRRLRRARKTARVLCLFSLGVMAVTPYASAQLPTPTAAILLIQDSSSSDPCQAFVPELLAAEGLNEFQTAQLSQVTSSFLSNYDVVILPHVALSGSQAALFQNYVNSGGILAGFRPDLQLAGVFGVASQSATLQEGWLRINNVPCLASDFPARVSDSTGPRTCTTSRRPPPLRLCTQTQAPRQILPRWRSIARDRGGLFYSALT